MTKEILRICTAALLVVLPLTGQALTIDEFITPQSELNVSQMGTTLDSSTVSTTGTDIIGLYRYMELTVPSGTETLDSSAEVASDRLLFANASTAQATLLLQWDGNDQSSALDTNGLGGVDLTDGNISDAFEINLKFDDLPANITLTVYSGTGNSSSATFPTTGGLVTGQDISFYIPFAAFTGSPDFTNIGAIEMSITGLVNGADLEIDYIRTTLEPVPVPPALILFASGLLGLMLPGRRSR